MKKKIITTAIICSLSALAAAGCASWSPQDAVETTSSVNVTEAPAETKAKKETAAEELSSSSIELNGSSISAGEGTVAEGSHVTINSPGIYEISGKDYLMINGGNISVNAGSDGIKATNDKEASLGYVEINGGNVDITAKDEGISAIYDVKVTGGDVKIKSENNGIKSENNVTLVLPFYRNIISEGVKLSA